MRKKSENLDKETKALLTDQERISDLTKHEAWPLVRNLFIKRAAELLNMAQINVQAPLGGNLLTEIGMRQLASARILEVLNEIQGTAEQFDMNSTLTEQVENGYVLRQPTR